jgi:carbon storage regulator
MLVLTRKIGESIVIDGGITVTVNRIAGNRVTLGIEAPASRRVLRGELKQFDSFQTEEREAARSRELVAAHR